LKNQPDILRAAAASLLLLLLAACAGLTPDTAPYQADAGSGAAAVNNPAVTGLLRTARTQRAASDYEHAAASIERALRIAPRDVDALQELAYVRLEQGMAEQAEALALKANSFAVGDSPELAENWEIIARARAMRGNMMGADAASRAAAALRGDLP